MIADGSASIETTSDDIAFAAARREAELEKLRAEAAKLRAEANETQQSWKKLWQRPAAWAAFLPAAATLGTAIYAFNTGLLDARQKEISAEDKIVIAKKTELSGEVKQLEAQKIMLESQRARLEGSLDAEKKLQEAQRERLALQNELLKKDQIDVSERKAQFEREKLKIEEQNALLQKEKNALEGTITGLSSRVEALLTEGKNLQTSITELSARASELDVRNESLINEKSTLEVTIASLGEERKKLQDSITNLGTKALELEARLKTSALQVPLENILANETAAHLEFNANYSAIASVLKRSPSRENRQIIEAGIKRAKTAPVQASLYRSLYFGTEDGVYLDGLVNVIRLHWKQSDQFFWGIFRSVSEEGRNWPTSTPISLFSEIAEILREAVASRENKLVRIASMVAGALTDICGVIDCSKVDKNALLNALTFTRDSFAFKDADSNAEYDALRFIYQMHPYAARLLFAARWRDAPSDLTYAQRGSWYLSAASGSPQPKAGTMTAWLTWLKERESDFRAVKQAHASGWPAGLVARRQSRR